MRLVSLTKSSGRVAKQRGHLSEPTTTMEFGIRLGHYEILKPLGKGSMGEVWRARDTKLGRDVAIKTLPDEVFQDADRLARFEREAKLLASLNHPNIAAIYGQEEHLGFLLSREHLRQPEIEYRTRFLVLELAEGDTLAHRLKRGHIAVKDSLQLALQITEALECAHEKGIIHGDLKPANVMVTSEGRVKVLDFGLSRAFAGDVGESASSSLPTFSVSSAEQGVVLGTPAYMSPEQTRGQEVDRRTDIWAFGCVLYEMLTGRPAFQGKDLTDTLAAVIRAEPEWSRLPAHLHQRIGLLLERCLEKEVQDRYTGIADARVDIQRVLADPAGVVVEPVVTVAEVVRQPKLPWVAAIVAVAFIAALSGWLLKPAPPSGLSEVARLTVTLPPGDSLRENLLDFDVSPNGASFAYVSNGQLYLRNISEPTPRVFSGTAGAQSPFFSPDGEWIGFFAGGELKKVPTSGGDPEALGSARNPKGASWAADGTIYFAPDDNAGIWRVSSSGGDLPEPVTDLDRQAGEISHRWPQVLPGGDAVLFTVWTGPGSSEKDVELEIFDTGERRVVAPGGETGRYVTSGHLVYAIEGDEVLMAVPFDLERLEVEGSPTSVEDAVAVGSEGALYAVSESGVLAYIRAEPARNLTRLAWVGRDGTVEPFGPEGLYDLPRLSPDGGLAAVRATGPIDRVALYDFAREVFTPVAGEQSNQFAVWHSNGEGILYSGTRSGSFNIYQAALDNGGREQRLTSSDNPETPYSVSSDGWLIFAATDPQTSSDLWALLLDEGSDAPRKFLATHAVETAATFSPDGRSVAYVSDTSGQPEVFLRPFPEGEPPTAVGPGHSPMWSPGGQELFYLSPNDDQLIAATIRGSGFDTVVVSSVPLLDNWPGWAATSGFGSYDVSPDGRFLTVVRTQPSPSPNEITVVLNWSEDLKRHVPVP
jgi:serine/threonine protein kinase